MDPESQLATRLPCTKYLPSFTPYSLWPNSPLLKSWRHMCVKELCDYLFVQSEVLSPQARYSNPEPTVGAGRAHFRSQWGKWGKSASHLRSSHTPLTTSVPLLLRWLWLGSPSLLRDRVKCLFSFSFIFISWRLITLQYCSGFCHTLTWVSHGFTCVPHPDPPSHLPLHPIPLGLPSAPGLSTCLMHPTWAGDLFHPR